MPMRNPFVRRPGVVIPSQQQDSAHLGFERVDTIGSKASVLSLGSDKSHEPGEYKMSGKCLPLALHRDMPWVCRRLSQGLSLQHLARYLKGIYRCSRQLQKKCCKS